MTYLILVNCDSADVSLYSAVFDAVCGARAISDIEFM